MSLALHYWMGDAHHCSGPPVSEMTYTVSSGTLNPSIPTWSSVLVITYFAAWHIKWSARHVVLFYVVGRRCHWIHRWLRVISVSYSVCSCNNHPVLHVQCVFQSCKSCCSLCCHLLFHRIFAVRTCCSVGGIHAELAEGSCCESWVICACFFSVIDFQFLLAGLFSTDYSSLGQVPQRRTIVDLLVLDFLPARALPVAQPIMSKHCLCRNSTFCGWCIV